MNIYKLFKAPNAFALLIVATFAVVQKVEAQKPNAQFSVSANTACGTTLILFTDKSTGNIDSWTWDFGRGTSAIVYDQSENPAITFTPGEYTVVLTVKSGTEESMASQKITIFEKPTAKFNVSANSGCVNAEFQFSDASESSAPINSYLWVFGDGESSTEKNPNHTYKESGKYTIGMTIVDDHGCKENETFSDYIQVTNPLTLDFSATQTQACVSPLTTTFTPTISGGTATSYLWDFGDGKTSTETNPSHTYSSDGAYTVKLTAADDAACESSLSKDKFININTSTADFTVTGSLCVNNALTMKGISNSTVTSWSWDFGDGSSASGETVDKMYTSEGSYTVKITAINSFGCTLEQTKTIEIKPSPVVSISSDKIHGCEEDDFVVTFTDNTTGGSEWSWDFGDGETSTEKSPSHKYTQVGVFNAILTVTDLNSCLATSDPIKITKMNPLSSFGIESDDDGKFCLGSTVTLSESVVSDFTITDYLWEPLYDVSKETSRGESGNNLIIVYGETGEYPLSLTVKDEDGCIGKMEDTVKIGNKPVLPTIVTENKCYKDVKENGLDFTVTPNDDANNWYWDFGDNNKKMVYEDLVNHIYDAPKDYHVTVLAKQYYCPADLAEIDIIVKAPSAEFAPNPEALCGFPGDITFDPSASQGAEKYLWDFGDGTDKIFVEALAEEGHFKWTNQTTGDVISEDSTSNVVVHTYQKSNKYDVKLVTSTDECEDDKTQTLNLSGILPGFVIDTMEVCMGVPVNFKDTSVVNYGSVASRRWIFGEDTVNADGATYAYAFSKAGTFDVSLKVENNFTCTDSLLKPMLITVYPLPEIVYFDEKNDNPYGCADFEVTFKSKVNKSSIDAEITGYLWNFGDGQASTEQVPTHTYAAGIFDVSLKITDEKNCTDELKKTQYIHSNKPSSEFQSEPLICYYTDFVPTIKSVEAIEYTWDWGDESTPTTSGAPDHSYSDVTISDTTYTVTLTAKDTIGCSTTTSKTVEVRRPISAFTASDSVFSCPPADVNFYNKSTGTNLTYLWNLPSTVVNPIWQFYTSGDYDITLTVTDDEGCSDIVTKPSYISISGPRGKLEINQTAGCTYDTIQFTGKDIFGATSRQWVFDDGRYAITDDVDSISYRYSIGGNYIPSLVLTDDNGCEVTVVGDKLTVYGVEFAFETDSILCEPTTVEIKNTSITIPIEADSWEWAFSTGDTVKTKDALVELGYGDFNMSLTANIGGCKYTMDSSSFLKILRTLDSQFETSQNPAKTLEMVTFTNTTDTAFGLPVFSKWDYGTGDTSDEFDGSHSYINAGDFTVSLTTYIHEECPNTFSTPITVIKEYLIPNVFTPNGDGINDRFLEDMPEVELIILNRWGQQVYKGFDGWDGTFNGQEMSAGTYYYLITLPNGDHFEGPLMLIRN